MQDFRNLAVWQKGHELTLSVYELTQQFPIEEKFGLTAQMRRAAASIPTNIAEGCVRSTDADFARFLHHSLGSASELEYQLILSKDLSYIDHEAWQRQHQKVNEIKRMLIAFIAKLKKN